MAIPNELAAHALIGWVNVVLFLAWFYWLWQLSVADDTRQRMFELRLRWLDELAHHPNAANTVGAQLLCDLLDANKRCAHRMTVPALIFFRLLPRRLWAAGHIRQAIERGFSTLPNESLKHRAQEILHEATTSLLWDAYRRSLLAIFVLTPLVVAIALWSSAFGVLRAEKRKLEDAELALAAGLDRGASRLSHAAS